MQNDDDNFSILDAEYGTEGTLAVETSPLVTLGEDEIDPRFTRVSYSSLLDFHACPRLFQLKKLAPRSDVDWESQITFAYGHAVGDGIAEYFETGDLGQTIWNMFLNWKPDYLAEDEKRKKSFWHAVAAIEMFASMRAQGFLGDYEVATYNGKPAKELSFRISLPRGFTFRGHMDLVLRQMFGDEALVLENKTNSGNYIHAAQYKNSAQAIGYSCVLDKIESGSSSYSVQYLVHMTRLERYEEFQFPKSYHQRALWLRDTLDDVTSIARYARNEGNYGIWPMRGESCQRFGKPCAYMDVCQLSTERLAEPLREKHFQDSGEGGKVIEYQFDMTLAELLESESTSE